MKNVMTENQIQLLEYLDFTWNVCNGKAGKANDELEISILQTYQHPNIICLRQTKKSSQHILFLMLRYCAGSVLQYLIRSR